MRVCEKRGGTLWCPLPVRFGCGGVLLSHTLPGAVPSPCQVLASGFGMGPGVSPGPWPPQIFNCHPTGHHARGGSWWVGDRIVDATEGLIHVTCRVSPCRPSDALVCSCHPVWVGVCVAVRLLVPVGSTPRGASTSGLSTTCSPWSLQTPGGGHGILISEQASRLDAFSGYPSRT